MAPILHGGSHEESLFSIHLRMQDGAAGGEVAAHQRPGVVPGSDLLLRGIIEHLFTQYVPHAPQLDILRVARVAVAVHGIVEHPGGDARVAVVHHLHAQERHVQPVEVVVNEHVGITPLGEGMSLHPAQIFLHQQRVGRAPVFVARLTQQDLLTLRHGSLMVLQDRTIAARAQLLLSRVGMQVVDTHQVVRIGGGLRHPSCGIVGGVIVSVVYHHVGGGELHLLCQARVLIHLLRKAVQHGEPEVVVPVGRCPVAVRLVEDNEVLDAGEAQVVHQVVEVVHRHLHPSLILFHLPGGGIVLPIHHGDVSVGAVLQQFFKRLYVSCLVVGAGLRIEVTVGAVDHAAHISRPHEVDPPE